MSAKGVRAGRAFVEIGTNDSALTKGLQKAQARLNAFANQIASIGTRILGAGTAIAAPFILAGRSFVSAGDDLSKMAQRTGVAVETLSRLEFAAQRSGANIDAVRSSLFRMQRALGDASRGSFSAQQAFADLGLSVSGLQGLNAEQQFLTIAERLAGLSDATVQASLGQAVLGRGFRDVLPLIQEGSQGIQQLFSESDRLGATWKTETANQAKSLADVFYDLTAASKSIGREIGSILAPILERLSKLLIDGVVLVRNFIEQNEALVQFVFKLGLGLTALGASLLATAAAIKATSIALGVLIVASKAATAALAILKAAIVALASPLLLIPAIFAGIGIAVFSATGQISKAVEWLQKRFRGTAATAVTAFGGIRDALSAGDWGLAASILWSAIQVEFIRGQNFIARIWGQTTDWVANVWGSATTRIRIAAIQGFSFLLNSWGETTRAMVRGAVEVGRFVSDVFRSMGRQIASIWRWAADFTETQVIRIMTVGDEQSRAAMLEMQNQDIAARDRRIAQERNRSDAELVNSRFQFNDTLERFMDEVQNDKDAVIGRITEAEAARRRQREEERNQAQREAEARLQAARDRLDSARDSARDAAEEAEEARLARDQQSDFFIPEFDLEALQSKLADGLQGAVERVDVLGSFSAAAFDRLGIGQTAVEDRTARAAEDTAANTNRLVQLIEEGATQARFN